MDVYTELRDFVFMLADWKLESTNTLIGGELTNSTHPLLLYIGVSQRTSHPTNSRGRP